MKDIKHYQIKRKLGTGGMGEVYEAFDSVLERRVAIKVVHGHLLEDPKTDERFMNEARAAAKLVHPNIVTIYEVGEAEKGRYIAMEYVDGRPLTRALQEGIELKPETAIKIAIQILSGLQSAHNMGIMHRDIKPDNILVLENDLAKILDFGIAKVRSKEGLTVAGDILGTVEYMAPEQMLGEKLDHRCDVFSAGVVLYQLLTKQLPFSGENPVNILYKVLNEDPAPPSHHNQKVGQELDQVVLRAITRSKEDRWESAEAFSNALEAILRSGNYPSVALPMDDEEFLEIEEDDVDNAPAGGELAKLRSVFVGREKEFKRVINLFRQSAQGHGNSVIVRGEAGVGKSTLTERFQNYAAQNDALILYGACLYQDGMDAYLPFIDAVRGFFNNERRMVSEEELAKIREIVRDKIPSLYPYAEALYNPADDTLSAFAKTDNDENLSEAILQFLSLLSSMHTVICTIDDLHWADQASLQLFHYLTHRIARSRILLIGISRTDRYDLQKDGKPTGIVDVLARIRREGRCEEVTLYRLAKEHCERLIDKALSPTLFTEEFYEVIYNETKGNPLFALETLKLLRESGGIFFKDGAWYNKQEGLEVTVPNRVEDVFVRRLSVLNDHEREILQVAAVCGYKFDASQLAKLTEISKIKLLKILQRIERDIQIISSDEHGFHFEHPMLRDLLYKEIPAALSREYHLMIAQEMEDRCGGEYGIAIGDAAQHFRRGGDHEKAKSLLYRAGERAFNLKAYREAGNFFMDFLDSEERSGKPYLDQSSRTRFYKQLGTCHEEAGRWKESIEAYHRLLAMAEKSEDPAGQVSALKRIGRIEAKSAEWEKALGTYRRCLEIVESNQMKDAFGWLYNYLGIIHFEQGDYDESIRFFEQTISASHNEVDMHLKANALMNMGIIANIRADHAAALKYYEEALEIFQSLNDIKSLTRIYHNMGLTHADHEDWEKAIKAYERCLALTDGVEDKQLRALVQLNLGKVYARKPDLVKAKKFAEKALKMFKLMGDIVNVAEAYHVFGLIQLTKGNLAEAELFLNQSMNINRQKDFHEGLAEANVTLAQLRERQQDVNGARTCYKEAIGLLEKISLGGRARAVAKRIAELDGGTASSVTVVSDTKLQKSSNSTPSQDFISAADTQH